MSSSFFRGLLEAVPASYRALLIRLSLQSLSADWEVDVYALADLHPATPSPTHATPEQRLGEREGHGTEAAEAAERAEARTTAMEAAMEAAMVAEMASKIGAAAMGSGDVRASGSSGAVYATRSPPLSAPLTGTAASAATPAKQTWQWREGRLLALELVYGYVLAQHTACCGADALSNALNADGVPSTAAHLDLRTVAAAAQHATRTRASGASSTADAYAHALSPASASVGSDACLAPSDVGPSSHAAAAAGTTRRPHRIARQMSVWNIEDSISALSSPLTPTKSAEASPSRTSPPPTPPPTTPPPPTPAVMDPQGPLPLPAAPKVRMGKGTLLDELLVAVPLLQTSPASSAAGQSVTTPTRAPAGGVCAPAMETATCSGVCDALALAAESHGEAAGCGGAASQRLGGTHIASAAASPGPLTPLPSLLAYPPAAPPMEAAAVAAPHAIAPHAVLPLLPTQALYPSDSTLPALRPPCASTVLAGEHGRLAPALAPADAVTKGAPAPDMETAEASLMAAGWVGDSTTAVLNEWLRSLHWQPMRLCLQHTLLQVTQCFADPRFELRRMADQVRLLAEPALKLLCLARRVSSASPVRQRLCF